jgi:hypothetical protein
MSEETGHQEDLGDGERCALARRVTAASVDDDVVVFAD